MPGGVSGHAGERLSVLVIGRAIDLEALRRQCRQGSHDGKRDRLLVERTGGWQWPNGPAAQRPVLIDPAGATAMAPSYRDYPELFVRWFQYNVFTPTLRIHGQRPATAIWDYGTAAEPVLAASLRLRYELLPYIERWDARPA